jgi:hypothetical protein
MDEDGNVTFSEPPMFGTIVTMKGEQGSKYSPPFWMYRTSGAKGQPVLRHLYSGKPRSRRLLTASAMVDIS